MRERFSGRSQDRSEDAKRSAATLRRLASKLINTGAEAVSLTRDELRTIVELNPRDAVGVLVESLLKGTDQLQTILVREAQRYLNAIDLRDELGKVLANYSIEVHATINFVPRGKGAHKKRSKGKQPEEAAELEAERFKVTFVPKEDGENQPAAEAPDAPGG